MQPQQLQGFTQDMGNTIAAVPGQEQLHWLHRLHTAVDNILCSFTATKIDTSGSPRYKNNQDCKCTIPKQIYFNIKYVDHTEAYMPISARAQCASSSAQAAVGSVACRTP